MKKFLLLSLLFLFLSTNLVYSLDISKLESSLSSKDIKESSSKSKLNSYDKDTKEISIKNMSDKEKLALYNRLLKNKFDRTWKFCQYPSTAIPGNMYLYPQKKHVKPYIIIPPGERMRIISRAMWAKVYVPRFDVIGYIDTMQACAYRGVKTVDWSKVMYSHLLPGCVNGKKPEFTPKKSLKNIHILPGNPILSSDKDKNKSIDEKLADLVKTLPKVDEKSWSLYKDKDNPLIKGINLDNKPEDIAGNSGNSNKGSSCSNGCNGCNNNRASCNNNNNINHCSGSCGGGNCSGGSCGNSHAKNSSSPIGGDRTASSGAENSNEDNGVIPEENLDKDGKYKNNKSLKNVYSGEVHMRQKKTLYSVRLAVIPAGAEVKLVANEGNWCRVAYNGKVGYVRSIYVGMPSSVSTDIPSSPTASSNHGCSGGSCHHGGSSTPPKSNTPAATDTDVKNITNNPVVKEILRLTNIERAKHGAKPLVLDAKLCKCAQLHAEDMAKRHFFNHNNPDGLSPFDRMRKLGIGYFTAAENIAMGQSGAASVMNSWMHSPGHRRNILNGRLGKIGIGVYKRYYVQNFTN